MATTFMFFSPHGYVTKRLGVSDNMSLWPPSLSRCLGGMDGKIPKATRFGWVAASIDFLGHLQNVPGSRGMEGKIKAGISKIESRCSFGVWNLKKGIFSCGYLCPLFPPPSVWEWWWTNILQKISWNLRVAHPTPKCHPKSHKIRLHSGIINASWWRFWWFYCNPPRGPFRSLFINGDNGSQIRWSFSMSFENSKKDRATSIYWVSTSKNQGLVGGLLCYV